MIIPLFKYYLKIESKFSNGTQDGLTSRFVDYLPWIWIQIHTRDTTEAGSSFSRAPWNFRLSDILPLAPFWKPVDDTNVTLVQLKLLNISLIQFKFISAFFFKTCYYRTFLFTSIIGLEYSGGKRRRRIHEMITGHYWDASLNVPTKGLFTPSKSNKKIKEPAKMIVE